MSLYGHKFLAENAAEDNELEGINLESYVQLIAYDDISRGSEEQIREFMESELANVLTERSVLSKRAVYKLNQRDIDKKRRIKMVAYQMAKENNDPAFKKMVFHRKKMKEYKAILMKKYGKKAEKIAAVSQREYIKAARKAPSTPAAPKADKEEDK